MIRLFYGIPGAGKTAAMVALGIQDMYGDNASWALEQANAEVERLNANGFNVTPPKSDHLVYCSDNMSIDVISPDFGHRRSLILYPDCLGIATEDFVPQFVYRCSTLLIDELPDYADCRNWQNFLTGCCRYWAKHRKHAITMYGTCQDLSQVELRIKKLAMITHVREMRLIINRLGDVAQTVWTFDNWDCYEDWEKGKDPTRETYVYNGDIREAYDTNEGEEEFYIGLDKADFSCEYSKYTEFTPDGIAEYSKKHPIAVTKKTEGAKK